MRIPRISRVAIPLLLIAGAALGISAKCLENDSLRIGPDGNWHIYGEIHNETDAQGLDMVLQGAAFDGAGRQIALAQATMCPSALSPGTFSAYDVEFSIPPSGAQPTSHKVNVVQGQVSASPLPPLVGAYVNPALLLAKGNTGVVGATHHGSFETALAITTGPIMRGDPNLADFMYCIVGYDSNGDVVDVLPQRRARVGGIRTLVIESPRVPAPRTGFVSEPTSRDVVSFRFLLWKVSASGTPLTAVATSELLPAFKPGPGDEGEF